MTNYVLMATFHVRLILCNITVYLSPHEIKIDIFMQYFFMQCCNINYKLFIHAHHILIHVPS